MESPPKPKSEWSTEDPRHCFNKRSMIVVDMVDIVCWAHVETWHGWSIVFQGVDRESIGEDDKWPGYRWTMRGGPSLDRWIDMGVQGDKIVDLPKV